MLRAIFIRSAWVSILACTVLQAQQDPLLKGYVTRTATAQDFDVDGVHVTCDPTIGDCRQRVYGEHLAIFGGRDTHTGAIVATRIESMNGSQQEIVSGLAVIDKVLKPDLLRADGFALQITLSTKVHREAPLTAAGKPAVDEWIAYVGKRDSKGVIVASSLSFYSSTVTPAEQKLRNRSEFDPAAVSDEAKQGAASKFFKGVDYTRIPAVHDPVQQKRIEDIGARLIPAYQAKLASGDPNKFNFRFQLVDSKWNDCVTLPNGIVLVPAHVAALLDDAQLGAVLADNIATALEKQAYRSIPAKNAMTASNIAADVAGIFVPGLGLATNVGTGITESKLAKHREEQSGRMSLVLLHDAGFDIQEAPIAWWRLAGKRPATDRADFMLKPAPRRAAYLFQTLATNWNPASPLLVDSSAVAAERPASAPETSGAR